jgi:hypothetical protein
MIAEVISVPRLPRQHFETLSRNDDGVDVILSEVQPNGETKSKDPGSEILRMIDLSQPQNDNGAAKNEIEN